MPDDRIPAQDPTIGDAFAALPLEAPERSAWPALAARIAATQAKPARRHARWWAVAAAAAAIGAVALLPREVAVPMPGASAPGAHAVAAAPAPAAADVPSLMAESARLEYLLAQVGGDTAGSASATALALEYEARVQQIDVALSDPRLSADQRAALWERRVGLLRDYAGVQGTAQWLAAQGRDFEGDLVAVF